MKLRYLGIYLRVTKYQIKFIKIDGQFTLIVLKPKHLFFTLKERSNKILFPNEWLPVGKKYSSSTLLFCPEGLTGK